MRVCKKAIFRQKVVKFQTQGKKEKCQMLPGKKQHRLPTANTSQSDWCRLCEIQPVGCGPYHSFLAAGLLLTLSHFPCPLCGEQSCTVDVRVTWVNVHKALPRGAHHVRLSSYCYANIRHTQASETASQKMCWRKKWHKPWKLRLWKENRNFLTREDIASSSPTNPLGKNYQMVCSSNHKNESR